jgi:hypothetical protein
MRRKVVYLLVGIILALMVVPFSGCGLLPEQTAYSEQEVIVFILNYGVRYLDNYYVEKVGEETYQETGGLGGGAGTGKWAATYEGEGVWTVTGAVATSKQGTCSTVWTFNEDNGDIELIELSCETEPSGE